MKSSDYILTDLLSNYRDCYVYLHNTREPEIACIILKEGLIFENQLTHSADRVNAGESVEIAYFLFQRKDYGVFTIIIAIPRAVYESYLGYCVTNDTGIEEVLSVSEPAMGENDEYVYRIPPEHIAGYFNTSTGEFVINRLYDPYFNALSGVKNKREKHHRQR